MENVPSATLVLRRHVNGAWSAKHRCSRGVQISQSPAGIRIGTGLMNECRRRRKHVGIYLPRRSRARSRIRATHRDSFSIFDCLVRGSGNTYDRSATRAIRIPARFRNLHASAPDPSADQHRHVRRKADVHAEGTSSMFAVVRDDRILETWLRNSIH